MTSPNLDRARVTPDQVQAILHRLAAANHRQWVVWERFVLPALPLPNGTNLEELAAGWLERDLQFILKQNAVSVIDFVKAEVGTFAYEPRPEPIQNRKWTQFQHWLGYASSQADQGLERWQLQCRTPFLSLTSDQQRSDYTEARADLAAVADAAGLVLPRPLPAVEPLTERQLRQARRRHSLGFHNRYLCSEAAWSRICVACHRLIAVTPP